MAKLTLNMKDGTQREIAGSRFSHYVGPYRFWFFLHKSVDSYDWDVTHYDSGKRVTRVPNMTLIACLGDEKAAAKLALDKLIERVGAERVRSVLAAG